MEGQILEKAVEDVQLIRKVMDRSSSSVTSLNKIFILWGAAFFTIGALSGLLVFIWPDLPEILLRISPLLVVLPRMMVAAAALIIYLVFREGVSDGLNRQFLVIWLAIVGHNTLWTSFNLLVPHPSHNISFIPGFSFISFAVGMLCMWIFTRMSLPGWMAFSYIILDVILNVLNIIIDDNIVTSYKLVLYRFILPLSLSIFGLILAKKRRKTAEVS